MRSTGWQGVWCCCSRQRHLPASPPPSVARRKRTRGWPTSLSSNARYIGRSALQHIVIAVNACESPVRCRLARCQACQGAPFRKGQQRGIPRLCHSPAPLQVCELLAKNAWKQVKEMMKTAGPSNKASMPLATLPTGGDSLCAGRSMLPAGHLQAGARCMHTN